MWPRWRGGGDTLDTLFRFVRVRRAGPPLVLGGFAGSSVEGARDRDRLLENSAAPAPLAETGDGVWRWPFVWPAFDAWDRWNSEGAVRFEKEEIPEILDMCEENEDGSAPEKGLLPLAVTGEDGLLDGGS